MCVCLLVCGCAFGFSMAPGTVFCLEDKFRDVAFFFFFLSLFIYFERERAREGQRERERERQNPRQDPSTVGSEPNAGSNSRTARL